MTGTDYSDLINLEDRFQDWLKGQIAIAEQKAKTTLNQEMPIIKAYLESRLSVKAFADKLNVDESSVRRLLDKYNIPKRLIDGKTMQRIRRKPNKIIDAILCDNCNCIGARTLRLELQRGKR